MFLSSFSFNLFVLCFFAFNFCVVFFSCSFLVILRAQSRQKICFGLLWNFWTPCWKVQRELKANCCVQPSTFCIENWRPSSNFLRSACLQTLQEWSNTKIVRSTSNFQRQKLEAEQRNFVFGLSWISQALCLRAPWKAEQKNLPWALLKTKAPKLIAFKGPKVSSNQFHQCNYWFLFSLLASFLYFA
jgi:hypothetical protein